MKLILYIEQLIQLKYTQKLTLESFSSNKAYPFSFYPKMWHTIRNPNDVYWMRLFELFYLMSSKKCPVES